MNVLKVSPQISRFVEKGSVFAMQDDSTNPAVNQNLAPPTMGCIPLNFTSFPYILFFFPPILSFPILLPFSVFILFFLTSCLLLFPGFRLFLLFFPFFSSSTSGVPFLLLFPPLSLLTVSFLPLILPLTGRINIFSLCGQFWNDDLVMLTFCSLYILSFCCCMQYCRCRQLMIYADNLESKWCLKW